MLVCGHLKPCGHTLRSCSNVRQICGLWLPKYRKSCPASTAFDDRSRKEEVCCLLPNECETEHSALYRREPLGLGRAELLPGQPDC